MSPLGCAFAVTGALALASCVSDERQHDYPTVDRMTAGVFLEEATERAAPPAGVQVRAVYPRGLTLTKDSEGFRSNLYNDAAGYCTIAYGHLLKKARCDGTEPAEFLGGVSRPAGERLLISDMTSVRWAVQHLAVRPLSDGQFAALSDFAFNAGTTALQKSTLLKRVNDGNDADVPAQFRRWVMAGGRELPGLKSRREREVELYFDGLAVPRAVPMPGEDLSPIDIRVGE